MNLTQTQLSFLRALPAGVVSTLAGEATAQTFTNLYRFTGSDGANPYCELTISGNTLFGTTYGGVGGGANPRGAILVSGNARYGTSTAGGISSNGTVFRIALPSPPSLDVAHSGTNVVLSWPATATGYGLWSATRLVPSPSWTAVSPAPAVVNGQNTVTNPISDTRKFYRLSQ